MFSSISEFLSVCLCFKWKNCFASNQMGVLTTGHLVSLVTSARGCFPRLYRVSKATVDPYGPGMKSTTVPLI